MLDIGSGEGERASRLKRKLGAKTLLMMESSQEMIDLCKVQKGEKKIKADITTLNCKKYTNKFDVITCLWNVFGHISSKSKRLIALRQIKRMVRANGRIYIDISNRYNMKYYGVKIVLFNIIHDIFKSENIYGKNGDFKYNIQLSKRKQIASSCHFFSKYEFDNLIHTAELAVVNTYYINYLDGNLEQSQFSGHLLYILERKVS